MTCALVLWMALADDADWHVRKLADSVFVLGPDFVLEGETGLFPPSAFLNGDWALAARHRAWLECRKAIDADVIPDIDNRIAYQAAVCEAHWALYIARESKSRTERRKYADDLRALLGEQNYAFGRLPPPLPWLGGPP